MYNLNNNNGSDLKLILDNISNAILFESEDRKIIYVNKSFCSLFRIPVEPDMIVGADCRNAANDTRHLFKNPQYFLDLIDAILRGGETVTNQELVMEDGLSVFLDYIPIKREGKIGCAHLWIYKNMNEINRFIQTANEQKVFYENLLNNIPADIAIFDHHHKYLFVNKNAIKSDERRSWIIGKDDYEYCTKYDRPTEPADIRSNAFREAVRTKTTVEFEERNINKDNEPVYNLRRFFPVIKESGEFDHIIGYGINITTIKLYEQNLLAREKVFKNLIESMDQMVVSVDDKQLIQYCNPKWTKVTGYKWSDCQNKKLDTFIKLSRGSFQEILKSFLHDGTFRKGNRKAVLKDYKGQKKIAKYYISAFADNITKSERYAVFMTDITDQVQAETELKKIAKQERKLNELKSNFMNMVSHELRTPLSVILSSTELIDLNLGKVFPQGNQLDKYTNRIIAQVDRMTQLMNDFLFISKIEAGRIGIKPVSVQPERFLKSVIEELYKPWKDGRSLEFTIKGKPFNIMADQMMLRHILVNIINNAFKYSEGKRPPHVRLIFNQGIFELLVIDYGIGIHEEDKKNLFSPFVRGSNVGDVEGTGLGLLVVKYFVELHKGIIKLKSIPNKGTAVLVLLPVKSRLS